MSDADETKSQKPTPETAAVPLKKETIRVTLRANPDASAADAPAPPKHEAPKPAAPAPTVPLGGAPKPAAPAPTVKLNTPSKPITPGGAPASPSPTKPLKMPGGAPSTATLPKATVNLSTTKLPGTPGATAPTREAEYSDDDTGPVELDGPESKVVPMVLSVILFLVAALVLYLEYQSNDMVDASFKVL